VRRYHRALWSHYKWTISLFSRRATKYSFSSLHGRKFQATFIHSSESAGRSIRNGLQALRSCLSVRKFNILNHSTEFTNALFLGKICTNSHWFKMCAFRMPEDLGSIPGSKIVRGFSSCSLATTGIVS
jgi:hypothetical protein